MENRTENHLQTKCRLDAAVACLFPFYARKFNRDFLNLVMTVVS